MCDSLSLQALPRRPLAVTVAMSPRWWGGIGAIRRFLVQFLRPVMPSSALTDKVAIIVHELLENAVKYSDDEDAEITVHVRLEATHVHVVVRNPARGAHRETLRCEVERVMTGDPFETYMTVMTRSLKDTCCSQIGLARIRYEASAELGLEVHHGHVSVGARVALDIA